MVPVRCEECLDSIVGCPLDRSIVIGIDVVAERTGRGIEPIVVVGVVVADAGPCGESGALFDAERAGATDASAADNGCLGCGAVGDL